MVRRTGNSRVGGGAANPADADHPQAQQRFPTLRERRPVVFWIVILAVLAMVLSTIASFATAFI